MEYKYLQDELNEARTALSIKKNALQKANHKIDGLKDEISIIKREFGELKRESSVLFDDFSSLLSASNELLKYLDPLELEEAKKIIEDNGFDLKVKYEITVRSNNGIRH